MLVSTGESAALVDAAHASANRDETTTSVGVKAYMEDGSALQHPAKVG